MITDEGRIGAAVPTAAWTCPVGGRVAVEMGSVVVAFVRGVRVRFSSVAGRRLLTIADAIASTASATSNGAVVKYS